MSARADERQQPRASTGPRETVAVGWPRRVWPRLAVLCVESAVTRGMNLSDFADDDCCNEKHGGDWLASVVAQALTESPADDAVRGLNPARGSHRRTRSCRCFRTLPITSPNHFSFSLH